MSKRLLWVGHAGTFTGMSRVTHAICKRLAQHYELSVLGVNYSGEPHSHPYWITPAKIGEDPHGVALLPQMVEQTCPHVIVLFADLWVVADYLRALKRLGSYPPVVVYTPIDGELLPRDLVAELHGASRVIVPSEFGREQLELAGYPKAVVIEHGVDPADFYPLSDRERLQARSELGIPEGGWLILNANRNQSRKDIGCTMEAFSVLASTLPEADPWLYLHMESRSPFGNDLVSLWKRLASFYKVEVNRCRFTLALGSNHPNLSTAQVNRIYNAADVGINTSQSEGFGLVALEHALTGRPQVLGNHTAQGSLWKDQGLLISPATWQYTTGHGLRYAKLDPFEVALNLRALYKNPDLCGQLAEAGQKLALSLGWDPLVDRFRGEIEQCFRFQLAASPVTAQQGERIPLPYDEWAGGVFNPCLSRRDWGWLGIARAESRSYVDRMQDPGNSVPMVFRLDHDFKIISHKALEFFSPFLDVRVDDFRFVETDEPGLKVLVSHVIWQQGGPIRQAFSTLQLEDKRLGYYQTLDFAAKQKPTEKNWCFWSHQKKLLALYDLRTDPIGVFVDPVLVPLPKVSDWLPDLSAVGVRPDSYLSVSSAPTIWDSQCYLFTFHQRDPQGIYHHWAGLIDRQSLALVAVSQDPILEGGDSDGNHPGFVIIGSAHRVGEEVVLAVGEGDRFCRIVRIPVESIQFWVVKELVAIG